MREMLEKTLPIRNPSGEIVSVRAVRCHELTGASGLRVDEIDPLEPASGEVVIDVLAAGVNFPDVLVTQGKYQFQPSLPFCPGSEVAGRVRAVGEGVTRVGPGDRVAATMLSGAFAEQAVAPEASVMKLPAGVDEVTAAGFLVTYGTAYHALAERAELSAGDSVLVLGAAGGVGLAAVEVAKVLGARVIAAASSPEKLEICRDHGADESIDYSREDLKDRAKTLSNGGVDVVVDPVGGDFAEPALRAMAWKGRYLVLGFAAGKIPSVPLNLPLLKGSSIVGVFWGVAVARDPDRNRKNVEQLLAWLAEGRLRPHISARLPLERAGEAIDLLDRRQATGKVVLTTLALR
jgi:NADPH:quinone reductase